MATRRVAPVSQTRRAGRWLVGSHRREPGCGHHAPFGQKGPEPGTAGQGLGGRADLGKRL